MKGFTEIEGKSKRGEGEQATVTFLKMEEKLKIGEDEQATVTHCDLSLTDRSKNGI